MYTACNGIGAHAGLAVQTALIALGVFAGACALYGGLKTVALTDIVRGSLLVFGGLIISYIAPNRISGGAGVVAGFHELTMRFPDKFQMIRPRSNPNYKDLPGLSVLLGGMWVMNVSYWGFNQYIIQRALGAKDIREAQQGIVLAAFLKLLMLVIIVLPGIAAAALVPNLARAEEAYPSLMAMLPTGILGLVFAALIAAMVASMGSKINSIVTIFTMDVYRPLHPQTSQHHLVLIGRLTAVVALVIAIIAARPLLGSFDQAFQYIQEFTGFFAPGICVIFLLGMFWERCTATAALAAAIGSAVLSFALKLLWPALPFMDPVGVVFLACLALVLSLLQTRREPALRVELKQIAYSASAGFNLAALAIIAILIAPYATWW